MKQIKLFLFLLFGFVSCQKQAESNTIVSKAKAVVNINKVKFETVGFSDKYDLLPKLNFQEIGEKEFNELKNSTNLLTKKSIKENLENYYLEMDNNVLELKKENKRTIGNRDGEIWYEYLGFYSSLDMYAFSTNSVSESLGFSDFELINKSNGKIYKIVSPGDGKIESPVPSSQTKYLAYFYNQVYNDNNSFLGILKIDSNKKLEEFTSFISEDFKIYQITWSKADVILIKVSSDNGKNFKYFKSDIPSKKNIKSGSISNKWLGTYKTYFNYGEIGGVKAGWNLEINIDKNSIIASGDGYQIGFKDELIMIEDGNRLILKHKKNLDGYSLGENMNPEFVLFEDKGKYYVQSEWVDSDVLTKPEKNGYKINKE